MADIQTSETYNNLLKAAEAAFSKIGNWNNSTTEGNKKMTASLGEIKAAMESIDKQKMNASTLESVAALDGLRAQYQKRAAEIQAYSDKANDIQPEPIEDNFPVEDMLGGAASLVKVGMAAELTNNAFKEFTGGSAQMAKSLVSNLREIAATSPFDSAELIKDAQSLLASGTAAESVIPTIKALGVVSGGEQDKLSALAHAFSTVQETGFLTADALAEMKTAGFDPLKGIPSAAGLEGDKLTQALKDGCIAADMVSVALASAAAANDDWSGSMETGSTSAANAFHRMNERVDAAIATVGASLMPIVTSFVDGALIPMAQGLQTVAGFISDNIGWIGGFVSAIGAGLVVYQLWAASQALVNAVMSANPIGLIIGGVAALIAGVIYLANSFTGFRQIVMGVWEVLKSWATISFYLVLGPIKGIVTGIMSVIDAIKYLMDGDYAKAGSSGIKALKDFTNISSYEAITSEVMNLGKNVGNAYNKARDEKISLKDNFSAPAIPDADKLMSGGILKADPKFVPKGLDLSKAQEKADGITSGGARSVTINLQKMFDNINISTNTISEGISDMEQQVTSALLRILNNANATA